MNLEQIFLTSLLYKKHYYTLACTGMNVHEKEFPSRELANEYMYRLLSKKGLSIKEKWKDNHDITYICNNNVRFYIQRV